MKLEKEWFCIECGEKLITNYFGEEYFGQVICQSCDTANDILDPWDLQFDGLEKFFEEENNGNN